MGTIDQVKGVGGKLEEKLSEIGIFSVRDLLEYYPNRYESFEIVDLKRAIHDEKVTVVGEIISAPSVSFYGKMKSRMQFSIQVQGEIVKVGVFNQQFLKPRLTMGASVTVSGKWDLGRKTITASNVRFGIQNDRNIVPQYRIKDVSLKTFQKILHEAFAMHTHLINDDLPLHIQQKYRLISSKDAIQFAHFPQNQEQIRQASRRIKYEELLKFQLKMQYLRQQIKNERTGFAKKYVRAQVENFIASLPFSLTNGQNKALLDIEQDLASDSRMNRLLQGDVGSGKTIVAAIAILEVVLAGYQTTLMVPTEILAKQHFASISKMFAGFSHIKIAFLSSAVKGKKRKEILDALQTGEIDLLIGTHALIQDDVAFKNLGLAVVDEQHRFGVAQRKRLRKKGEFIDILMMSATPIPRTLAISAFGDMDVSNIREMPMGRKSIQTHLVREEKLADALHFIREKIQNENMQIYVITPLIEESEALEAKNATQIYEEWRQHFKSFAKVGLMHGRLPQEEKDSVMNEFAKGELQILISTTVIEVGVNVPNANLIFIYDANRFGLSQLHQLRGRVGRGQKQAYCLLMSTSKSKDSLERLNIMTQTTDGFKISEADLKLRGPGDFFGNKQSGIPTFKMANLIEDYKILDIARVDAAQIIATDEFHHNNEYLALRDYIKKTIANEQQQFD